MARILAVYKTAAIDESAAAEASVILERARELLGVASVAFYDGADGSEGGDFAGDVVGDAYAGIKTAEVDLHASLLRLAAKHLDDGSWELAAKQAAAIAHSGLLFGEASRLAADALLAGLQVVLGAENKDLAELDRWITDGRRRLVSEAGAPELLDEVLLTGMDAAFAVSEETGTGLDVRQRPKKLDHGIAIARAYVQLEPRVIGRQAEAGERIAMAIQRYPLRWVISSYVPKLTLPRVKDLADLQRRLDTAVLAAWSEPKPTPEFGYDPEFESSEKVWAWRDRRMEALNRLYTVLGPALEGALFSPVQSSSQQLRPE